jgi:hypothetical protein
LGSPGIYVRRLERHYFAASATVCWRHRPCVWIKIQRTGNLSAY